MKLHLGILALIACAALARPATIRTGPEVGAKMPGFTAPDQNGKQHSLTDLLGPKGAVLVVYRSADW